MRAAARLAAALLAAGALAGCDGPAEMPSNLTAESSPSTGKPIRFTTADHVTIFGKSYPAARPRAIILLFHQAGSGKGEYAAIAPRLQAAGYSAIAVDQRSGGELYGVNETVAALGRSTDYLEAKRDMQAAVDFASKAKLPIILWGSSYSSSLVFPLAVENPGRIRAILAFSPGEYFADKHLVAAAAVKVSVPVFVTSASDPAEIAVAQAIVAAVPGGKAEQYVPATGVHGSSTLIASKNPTGAETNWRAALAFLMKVTA